MSHPQVRARRLRRTPGQLREPVVGEGIDEPRPVPLLPGLARHSVGSLPGEARRLAELGIGAWWLRCSVAEVLGG